MGLPSDPWRNPDFVRRRPKPVQRAWRSGRKRVFGVLLATAAVYAAWSLVAGQHGILEIWAAGSREAELRAEIADADVRLAELDRQLEDVGLAVEAKARLEYGYSEPNELIFVDSVGVGMRREAGHGGGGGERPGRP